MMIWLVDTSKDEPGVRDHMGRYPKIDDYPFLLRVVRRSYIDQINRNAPLDFIRSARWTFVRREEDRFGAKECVYFFSAAKHPTMLKIGAAKALGPRLYQHRSTYGRELHVWALGQTPEYLALEAELHTMFAPFRAYDVGMRDWFQADIVFEWLRWLERTLKEKT